MDAVDTIAFLGWSAGLAVLDFTAWQIIGLQAAWLTVGFIGRRIIDVRFERREG